MSETGNKVLFSTFGEITSQILKYIWLSWITNRWFIGISSYTWVQILQKKMDTFHNTTVYSKKDADCQVENITENYVSTHFM